MASSRIVLGIETSCDETSVSVVTQDKKILSHLVFSQEDHRSFGGVVPELAARRHLDALFPLLQKAINESGKTFNDIDAICATSGPGLIGGLVIGVSAAKTMAAFLNKPFIAVNHLEGHALTARLSHNLDFPYLLLLVSGGHCQFLVVKNVGDYECLGQTIDDAVGEAFDKVAKLLGLGYPGGPLIEKHAFEGDPKRFDFPRPLIYKKDSCNLSFSGLKTAVRLVVEELGCLTYKDKGDIAASFQSAVIDCLVAKTRKAYELAKDKEPEINTLVVGGGVAANKAIRSALESILPNFVAPPMNLCTDNAAMIAWAGLEHFMQGRTSSLHFTPKPRWSLTKTLYKEVQGE